MKLTSELVHNTFMNCLFDEGESTEGYIAAQGVSLNIGFHPQRVEENKEVINEMLNDLPDTFKENGGGGMSFLNLCYDKEDTLWTGSHNVTDELVCLGLAVGRISFCTPREMWKCFPSGLPYLTVLNDK